MGTIRRVTDAQVKELRKWLQQGALLSKAALKSMRRNTSFRSGCGGLRRAAAVNLGAV